MCGICGKLFFNQDAHVSPALIKKMADTIAHRGPDDDGYYFSGPLGLGFRRLSIIDLSEGHQPLSNEDGTVWVVFNGEIYNYRDLRQELLGKGHVFRTQSDTEVLVHLYEELGEGCVEKLRGMFAFAIWDDRQKTLLLARDRVGIKPLYYRLTNDSLTFGSEIKAILADPEVKPEVLPAMIGRFLTFNYIPGEETLFQDIYKVPPGSYMVVRENKWAIKQYWDLQFSPMPRSLRQAETELLDLMDEAVRMHMISDVPVGFLLSGGVDSTALLSFAARKRERRFSSYTLGFTSPGITDERPYANLAAKTYGTEHHEMTISAKDFHDFLPKYVWHMEEPVCEPPAVALYYISRLAKNDVKVLISGEGGDEAFAGYPNYRTMLWMERLKSMLGPFNGAFSKSLSFLNERLVHSSRLANYAPLLSVPLDAYYYSRTSTPFSFFNQHKRDLFTMDFAHCVDQEFSLAAVKRHLRNGPQDSWLNKMLYVDTKTWLVDDLLLKADKMTMANSIELRVPLLDHKVLEFAASLPEHFKVHGLTLKYIAKRTLNRQVPKEILERKKTGFPVPYASWLRTDLRAWLHDILLDGKTISRGYFNKRSIEILLADNLQSGRYSKEIFSLAVLELWHRTFLDRSHST